MFKVETKSRCTAESARENFRSANQPGFFTSNTGTELRASTFDATEPSTALNILKAAMLLAADWQHYYPREQAAHPLASLRQSTYWPPVAPGPA